MTDQLLIDVEKQELGSNLVEMFEIMIRDSDEANDRAFYIHNGINYADPDSNGAGKNIHFPRVDQTAMNTYIAIPVEIEGIATSTGGASNRPTLRIANIPVLSRTLGSLGDGRDDEQTLFDYLQSRNVLNAKSFLGATVRYRSTLEKYTYDIDDNIETPTEFPMHTFIIDRISGEDNLFVEFELANPAELDRVLLPGRKMSSKYCMWKYQGAHDGEGGCNWPKGSNGIFVDQNDEIITTNIASIGTWNSSATYSVGDKVRYSLNPGWSIYEAQIAVPANINPTAGTLYWKRIDVCGKRLNSCKIRFQGNTSLTNPVDIDNDLDNSKPLPFGGYPGTQKAK
jgi:phage-related protein